MKKLVEEHKATVSKIVEEQKAAMASFEQRRIEDLEDFKKETLQNFNNFLHELNANILFHIQVTDGPFDAHRVYFDTFYDVVSDQLGFDVRFSSRAA
ncbi:hypothetical protein PVK06_002758 [Gossypium arboreum]|uniref:Uncharacterized protein n=1 Tax=Gossypium arboreum TaxID=29729 RepID=A0ABR0R5J7_GOSAR|nr:hypothetical protein PVK06_002758 [Gossypium arboreum]